VLDRNTRSPKDHEARVGGSPVNNLLIAIAVFIITVLGALFAVPHFIDWNSYRSAFEEEARNVIGREVQVDGDVALYLLPTPYFRVEKVRIADTATPLTEHFFKTESLSIKLSIAPLLRGVVEVNEIEFQRPVLRVAQDAKGAWNWQDFAQALSSTGYMPANVTLSSLRIVNGVLALHGADGAERTRLDGLNGELSAPALEGPYRFRGTFTSGGATREVRISTASPEPDGKVPLRLSLRQLDTGATYVLDARAIDLMGKTRLEGDLTARLPIAGPPPAGAQRASSRSEEEPRIDQGETPLEVKAKIKADVAGASFSDLTLTFELGDRPQTVTGTAQAFWRTPVTLDMNLSSRWLDLDRLAGAAEGAGPAASVAKLAAWVRDLLPGDGVARVGIAIEQANLSGEAIGPLRLALARSANKLEIGELRTNLPGGTRVDLKGDISGAADALAYRGDVGIKGTSTARFATWATGNALAIAPEADGPLDLNANIAVDPAGGLAVRDFAGMLAGTALKGSGGYKWRDRPELTVALEGPRLDARGLLPADMSLLDLFNGLLRLAPAAKAGDGRGSEAGKAMSRLFQADIDLRLKAGQLVTAARTYRDFSTAVVTRGDSLKQLNLRLAGEDGYNLDLEGRVDNLSGPAKGTVRGHVVAQTADSIAPLAALLGLPAALRPGDSRQQAIAPLRLAGSLSFGSRTQTSADLVVDGEANGAPVKINARFDGAQGGWRNGRADVTASVESNDAGKIVAMLLPGSAQLGRAGAAKPGRILIRGAGVPSQGLMSLVSVDAGELALTYRGQVTMSDAATRADGDLELRAGNGTALASLLGLAPALRADGVPVSAKAKLGLDGSTVSLDKLALQVGASRMSGKIALSGGSDGRRRVDATLSTEEISVPTLLSPLVDLRFGAAGAAEAVLLGRPIPWPDEPFSAAMFDAFEGQVRLNAKRLTLVDGMGVEGAKLHVVLQPGRIEVKELDGATLGGEIKASVSFKKAPAGAEVRGNFAIGLMLEEIPGARSPRASGPMIARVEFAGRGLSPRAVVSALTGEGNISFDDAKLPGLAPGAVAAAADAAVRAEPGKLAPTLRQVLSAGLGTGSLPTGQASSGLEIVDGVVRSRPLVMDTSEGRASGTAKLDLKTLKLDSQWRLEARMPAGGAAAKPLPAAVVSYRAPLATLGAAELQIDTAVLEQELAARKIERDMEELERLRKLNEAGRPPVPAPTPAGSPPPSGPAAPPIPPFGHEVRPGAPG
jgi:uncharacterized protein involved in outer membrane biogenesis